MVGSGVNCKYEHNYVLSVRSRISIFGLPRERDVFVLYLVAIDCFDLFGRKPVLITNMHTKHYENGFTNSTYSLMPSILLVSYRTRLELVESEIYFSSNRTGSYPSEQRGSFSRPIQDLYHFCSWILSRLLFH